MEDDSAASVAAKLIDDGYDPDRVRVLKDGLAAWEAEGLPVARGEPASP